MPPVSAGAFARLFGELDRQAKRQFVADLYRAREWEVRCTEDGLSVSRDGDERRVAVVEPPRFRSVDLPDADEVVVTRDRGDARSAAEAAGITYRTPADLRDLVLYGVDRETAAELFAEYFDRSLTAAEPTTRGIDVRDRLAALAPSVSWNARHVAVALGVLLVVAVWAGSAGVFPMLDSEAPAPEVNGTYTPGAVGAVGGEAEYPPGLGPDGVENSGKLTLAHYQYLDGRSSVYRISASGPQHAPFMQGLSQWNATVRIRDDSRYWYQKRAVAPHGFRVEQREENRTVWVPKRPADVDNTSRPELLTKQVHADGLEKFWRYEGPERVVYERARIDQGDERTFFIADQVVWIDIYIQQYLWTENSSISCISETETRSCETYRVEATGDPVDLRGDQTDYRAVAVVEQSGFVRELTVEYKLPSLRNQSRLEPVRFHLEYVEASEAAEEIPPPEWLDEAKNRTVDSTTATATTANETSLP